MATDKEIKAYMDGNDIEGFDRSVCPATDDDVVQLLGAYGREAVDEAVRTGLSLEVAG